LVALIIRTHLQTSLPRPVEIETMRDCEGIIAFRLSSPSGMCAASSWIKKRREEASNDVCSAWTRVDCSAGLPDDSLMKRRSGSTREDATIPRHNTAERKIAVMGRSNSMPAKKWLSRLRDMESQLDKVLDDIYKGEVPLKDARAKLREFEKQLKELKSKLK
jgi:hypothetical protein